MISEGYGRKSHTFIFYNDAWKIGYQVSRVYIARFDPYYSDMDGIDIKFTIGSDIYIFCLFSVGDRYAKGIRMLFRKNGTDIWQIRQS